MKNQITRLAVIILQLSAAPFAFAETMTLSWDPVTTYSDGTSIESAKTVSYTAYWATDAGLSTSSLHQIASSLTQSAATFDPALTGMAGGQTVYFTARAVLSTGEQSGFSAAYPWVVPSTVPPPPPSTPPPTATPSRNPAAPENIGITGPVSSAAGEVWRLAWDPVTTYGDGASIEADRTVLYAPYWTTDPALSPESLKSLASSISGTTVEFDPAARQMVKNQTAYLTVKTILDNGDQSSPGSALTWRVENEGPVAPSSGKISKR